MIPAAAPDRTREAADCLTTDGRVVTIRPAEPGDADALVALHDRSSDRTRYFRFFQLHRYLSEEDARHFVTVDHAHREALVVVERGTVVGIGGYDGGADPTVAELSFLVDDAHQHRGIGSLLLEHLSAGARARGFHRLQASVLATNRLMLDVFARAGFVVTRDLEAGVVELELDIDDLAAASPAIVAREHVADVASTHRLLQPEGIVFVTGPPEQDDVGRALATSGSVGATTSYAVNPAGASIGAATGQRSLDEVPEGLDLAVLTIGAEELLAAIEACGERQVASVVVTTPPTHPLGLLALREAARAAGVRLLGPGSAGLEDRHRGLHALLGGSDGPKGPVGIACQSASVARTLTAALDRRGVGVATVVTLGAKADVSGNDLLQAWSEDPTVEVAVLQLESLGNPYRFARIARTVGPDLPVVLLRTAGLHDALTGTDPDLLRQLGIIDVPSIDEAVAVAALLAGEPRPAGRRVGVVSRGRGPGLVVRDRLVDAGLDVTRFRVVAPDRPLADDLRAIGISPEIDALCVLTDEADDVDVPRSVVPASVPVVVCGPGSSADRAARSLARATEHSEWSRHVGQPVELPGLPDRSAVRSILRRTRCRMRSGWIDLDSVTAALHAYGIAATSPHVVSALDDAGEAALQEGYPVVLDHPSGHGDDAPAELANPGQLAERWEELLQAHGPAALPLGVLAAGPRPELSLHVTAHPALGPLLTVAPSDRRSGPVRLVLPLDAAGLDRLLDDVVDPTGRPTERATLHDLVVRVAALVADHPELIELHLDAVDTSVAPATVTGAHLAMVPTPGGGDDQTRHLRRDIP